jgi:hypothetical protein
VWAWLLVVSSVNSRMGASNGRILGRSVRCVVVPAGE